MDDGFHYDSPLGGITLTGDGDALTGLWFDGQKHIAAGSGRGYGSASVSVFSEAKRWLDVYFSGTAPDFTPKLALRASPFREAVWEILLAVPYGETVTYGEIAARVARRMGLPRMSAQAVGGAVGCNPIALIVPCHRVIGAGGRLSGYAGGADRKARLLEMEKSGVLRVSTLSGGPPAAPAGGLRSNSQSPPGTGP